MSGFIPQIISMQSDGPKNCVGSVVELQKMCLHIMASNIITPLMPSRRLHKVKVITSTLSVISHHSAYMHLHKHLMSQAAVVDLSAAVATVELAQLAQPRL